MTRDKTRLGFKIFSRDICWETFENAMMSCVKFTLNKKNICNFWVFVETKTKNEAG